MSAVRYPRLRGRAGRVALALVAAFAAALGSARTAHAAVTVPYTDSQSVGFITLYDKDGKQVKGGNVHDRPFVSKAVGSQRAPAPYDADGRKVTLLAYQPRKGVQSDQWSGDTMTAPSAYPDAAHPAVVATAEDFTLQDFLDEFPPQWDGVIQLRMYFGVPNQSTLTTKYLSTDLRVSGQSWAVVGGGPGAGAGGADIPGVGGGAAAAAGEDARGAGDPGARDSNPIANLLPGVGTPGTLAIAAAVVVGVLLAGALWRRRARRVEDSDEQSTPA